VLLSAGMYLGPFIIFGWPIKTVASGVSSWFNHAGALSPFNLVAIQTGTEQLPSNFWWAGYLIVLGLVILSVYAMVRKPQNLLYYALLSAAVFFTLRPWNSEQNLVIVLTLFLLLKGELPSRWLWVIPMLFALANNAPQQQLYLLVPTIVGSLDRLYSPFQIYRLWLKFILSMAWLVVLWFNIVAVRDYLFILKNHLGSFNRIQYTMRNSSDVIIKRIAFRGVHSE
jgi:hypothetical protein